MKVCGRVQLWKSQARADQTPSVTVTQLSQGGSCTVTEQLQTSEEGSGVLDDNWVNVITSFIYLSNQATVKQLLELKNGTTVKNWSWFHIIFPLCFPLFSPFVFHCFALCFPPAARPKSHPPILYLNSPLSKILWSKFQLWTSLKLGLAQLQSLEG